VRVCTQEIQTSWLPVRDYIDRPTSGQSTLFTEIASLLMPIEQDVRRAKLLHSSDISAVADIVFVLPVSHWNSTSVPCACWSAGLPEFRSTH
jgi:hypothetical protein